MVQYQKHQFFRKLSLISSQFIHLSRLLKDKKKINFSKKLLSESCFQLTEQFLWLPFYHKLDLQYNQNGCQKHLLFKRTQAINERYALNLFSIEDFIAKHHPIQKILPAFQIQN